MPIHNDKVCSPSSTSNQPNSFNIQHWNLPQHLTTIRQPLINMKVLIKRLATHTTFIEE